MWCSSRIFCLGTDALRLYAEIHQNSVNQILHGLGMPFIGYAVFGLAPILINYLLFRVHKYHNWAKIRFSIYAAFVLYYLTFDPIGAIVTAVIYAYPLYKAEIDIDTTYFGKISNEFGNYAWKYYVLVFLASLFVQEGIGHTFFESANSDLFQLPNSISISPLFGTRALLHNFFGLPLIPNN